MIEQININTNNIFNIKPYLQVVVIMTTPTKESNWELIGNNLENFSIDSSGEIIYLNFDNTSRQYNFIVKETNKYNNSSEYHITVNVLPLSSLVVNYPISANYQFYFNEKIKKILELPLVFYNINFTIKGDVSSLVIIEDNYIKFKSYHSKEILLKYPIFNIILESNLYNIRIPIELIYIDIENITTSTLKLDFLDISIVGAQIEVLKFITNDYMYISGEDKDKFIIENNILKFKEFPYTYFVKKYTEDELKKIDNNLETTIETIFETDIATTFETDLSTTFETDLSTTFETDIATTFETDIATTFETDLSTTFESKLASTHETTVESKIKDPSKPKPSIKDYIVIKRKNRCIKEFSINIVSSKYQILDSDNISFLLTDIETELTTGLETDLATGLETELATNLATNFETNLATNLATNFETNLATNIATNFETDLATNFETDLATNLAINFETDLATNLSTNFETELATTLATKFETDLDLESSLNTYDNFTKVSLKLRLCEEVEENKYIIIPNYHLGVYETEKTIVKINVDKGIVLKLSEIDSNYFFLSSSRILYLKDYLDYEKLKLENSLIKYISIIATDAFNKITKINLSIEILNVDENEPKLVNFISKEIIVPENQSKVYNFTANKPVYWYLDGIDKYYFKISKGELSFKNKPNYETIDKKEFDIKLELIDYFNQKKVYSIKVILKDINENPPKILIERTYIKIYEGDRKLCNLSSDQLVFWSFKILGKNKLFFAHGILSLLNGINYDTAYKENNFFSFDIIAENINSLKTIITITVEILPVFSMISFGDPHIITLYNKMYELPKKVCCYRLLQSHNFFINIKTRNIYKNEHIRIRKLNKFLVNDGVLYHKFYIFSNNYYFIYDFDTTHVITNNHNYFNFKKNKLTFRHKKIGKIIFEVVKSKNPQNKNNFRVTIKGNKDLLDGLLIREYLASSMETIGLKDTHLIKGVVGKNLINSQLHIINK